MIFPYADEVWARKQFSPDYPNQKELQALIEFAQQLRNSTEITLVGAEKFASAMEKLSKAYESACKFACNPRKLSEAVKGGAIL
jgi:hypothetical protein